MCGDVSRIGRWPPDVKRSDSICRHETRISLFATSETAWVVGCNVGAVESPISSLGAAGLMRGHEAPGTAVLQQAILQAAVVCDVSMQTAGCGAAPSKI